MKTKLMTTVMVVGVAALMSACGGAGQTPGFDVVVPPPDKSISMAALKGEDEFAASLKEHSIQEMESNFDAMKDQCQFPYVYATAEGGSGAVDISSTNVQEEKVDEADIVKADNGIVYALDHSKLHIVKVENSKKLTTLADLAIEGKPDSLYVNGSTAIVFSQINKKTAKEGTVLLYNDYYELITKVTFIDVADPAHPKVIRESQYGGALTSSRRIGHAVHVVITTDVKGPDLKYPDFKTKVLCGEDGKPQGDTALWNQSIEDAKVANRAVINAYDYKSQLPATPEKATVRYFDSPATANAQMLTVVSIDASKSQNPDKISVVAGAGNTVYASARSLFVAGFEWSGDKTIIHHFSLSDGNAYAGTTAVEGRLINQFAMSEYKGVLRVASTIGHVSQDGTSQVENRISTISTQDVGLPHLGELAGIAKGEMIYAVRFVGERAFVVTFKKVDPLFVISLRDPKNPSIMGELKVPGFSTYLHPLDDSNLIGLGMDAQDMGSFAWFQGMKLSLFNVSDSTQPTETQATIIGGRGSSSVALFDHHAFTYDVDQKLLALPVTVYSENPEEGGNYGEFQYNGMQVYRVDTDKGFELLGTYKVPGAKEQHYFQNSYSMQRGLFVNDGQNQTLLTVQTTGLSLHQLDANLTESSVVTW